MRDSFADLPARYRTMPAGDLIEGDNTPVSTSGIWVLGALAFVAYVLVSGQRRGSR